MAAACFRPGRGSRRRAGIVVLGGSNAAARSVRTARARQPATRIEGRAGGERQGGGSRARAQAEPAGGDDGRAEIDRQCGRDDGPHRRPGLRLSPGGGAREAGRVREKQQAVHPVHTRRWARSERSAGHGCACDARRRASLERPAGQGQHAPAQRRANPARRGGETMKRFAALMAVMLACMPMAASPLYAQERKPQARPTPSEDRVNFNFRATPIEEAFDMLSRKDGTNIILSKGVTGTVTVNLYNVTVREAIFSVAQAAGYGVEVRNGDYIILGKETSLDYPGANTQIKTFKVHYSDAKQVADILSRYVSRQGKVTPLIGRKLIVVEDLPGFAERVGRLLEELDAQPRQVMIEAKILEITLNESERFGIDWKRLLGPAPGTRTSFGTTGLAFGNAAAPGQGFFFSFLNDNMEAFLGALATQGRVRTLATPKLLALENQEAKAVIGDSTGFKVTTTINLVTTETIQFLESGVILKVTPSVDQRGRVLMKVHPEVSSASLSDGVPSKKSTEVTTELLCEDGQSIFIGGLIKTGSTVDRQGIPILGDIPLLGRLFSNSVETVSSSETIVIITPYVIREPWEAKKFSEGRGSEVKKSSDLLEHQIELQGEPVP